MYTVLRFALVILSVIFSVFRLPVSAQTEILDLDPATIGKEEKQTWIKIRNEDGNSEIILKVLRIEPNNSPVVDSLRRVVKKGERLLDVQLVVKKSWFASPPVDEEHHFNIELFDKKLVRRASRELVVQTAAKSYGAYYNNSIEWLTNSRDWQPYDTVLVFGTVITVDGKTITFSAHGTPPVSVFYDPKKVVKSLPIGGDQINAYVTRSDAGFILQDFARSE